MKEFSEESRSGAVILDDGTVIPMPAETFSRSGLRKLSPGQRVRFRVEGAGDSQRVVDITLATL